MSVSMQMKFVSADESGSMNYAVYYPQHYEDLPLLVYLHGAGERGTEFDHLYRHGVPLLLRQGRTFPAVILVPQCPTEVVWCNVVQQVKAIIDTVAAAFSIRPDRICITGSSMGGYGTWSMALTYPSFFSAAAPIAGGGMAWRTTLLKGLPIWTFHGNADPVVNICNTQDMVECARKFGADVKYTILDGVGHEAWDFAYLETRLLDWLIEHEVKKN